MNLFYHLLTRLKERGITPTGFIDAGAHFGETNDTIRSVYPDSRVISFEANPSCESVLKQKGVEYLIGMLGRETTEHVPFYVNPENPTCTGCSMFKEKSEHYTNAVTLDLPMYRLDEVVTADMKLNFLKMDVQGAELSVLDGAHNLMPHIRWIYLEVSFVQRNEGCPLFGEVFDYLRARGYQITDMCDPTWLNNQLIQSNFLFER